MSLIVLWSPHTHKIKLDFLLLLIFVSFYLFDQLKEPRAEEGHFPLADTSEGPLSIPPLTSGSEALSAPFDTLIKLCYTKAPK